MDIRDIKAKGGRAVGWLTCGGSRAECKKWLDPRGIAEAVEPPGVAGGFQVQVKTCRIPARVPLL